MKVRDSLETYSSYTHIKASSYELNPSNVAYLEALE